MRIEPLIYKLADVSGHDREKMLGHDWRAEGIEGLELNPDFEHLIKEKVALDWDAQFVSPIEIIKQAFVEQRAGDFGTMRQLADVTGEF